jgi:hypothetical protein
MLTPYLTSYCAQGSSAVAFVASPRDILPTRERSFGQKSLFTFKNCHVHSFTTTRIRGQLPKYVGRVFGEVASIEPLVCIERSHGPMLYTDLRQKKNRGLMVELACPADATCLGVDLYNAQLFSLFKVIEETDDDKVRMCHGVERR